MRIGIVCFSLSFIAGGPRLIFGLARSLEKRGHKVIIYAPDFDAEYFKESAKGLDIRVVKPEKPLIWTGRPSGFFAWIRNKFEKERRLIRVSKQIAAAMDPGLDVVNIHDFAYRTGYYYKKRNPLSQVIWTENAPPFMYIPKGRALHDVFGWLYQWSQEVVSRWYFRAIDKVAVLDILNEKWSGERGLKNIRVIRCGVDFYKFYAPVKDFSGKAKKKSVQLFALGALNFYRRYDIVARSVKILRDKGIDARALVVCNNIWDEGGVMADLQRLVSELGIERFVEFKFAGVSEPELRLAYKNSDFFVQAVYVTPPGNHGWGIVNFEGMAAGLPVILVRSATATEVLKDNASAFFMDPLSPDQIADKVMRCIADPGLYAKVAKAGQEVARGMTWEQYTEETIDFFRK